MEIVDLGTSFPTNILYLIAKIGVHTAENGPFKICDRKNLVSTRILCNIALQWLNGNASYGQAWCAPIQTILALLGRRSFGQIFAKKNTDTILAKIAKNGFGCLI